MSIDSFSSPCVVDIVPVALLMLSVSVDGIRGATDFYVDAWTEVSTYVAIFGYGYQCVFRAVRIRAFERIQHLYNYTLKICCLHKG